jgi:phosphatidylserine/phosphatidylglycerophosphate/cardiolipin synthase-like enzyme
MTVNGAFDWARRAGLETIHHQAEAESAVRWLLGANLDGQFRSAPQQESGPAASSSSIFLPGNQAEGYYDYVRPPTAGTATLLINGRSSGGRGANLDVTEPLDRMQDTVQSLRAGDRIYLAAWFFEPATMLTRGSYAGLRTWGELLARKADEGVVLRLLINDFDSISGMDRWLQRDDLDQLNPLISALPEPRRDNFKYVVSLHPANVGALKALVATGRAQAIHIASHHQKFMVCLRGDETIAFCGGLDIESRKTPAKWSPVTGLRGWHDVHLMLTGPVARDLQREFVWRWNRERLSSRRPALPGWRRYEMLPMPPATFNASDRDMEPARRGQWVQMLRTVASDSMFTPYSTERDDIRRVYDNIVQSSRQHIYLENQYFRSLHFADSLARAATTASGLIAVFVVVASAAADDGQNAITAHGAYLQHEFFRRVMAAFGSRARVYTMTGRAVHSKVVLADDRYACIGSANANDRSFELDSELNIAIDDAPLVRTWRQRLWSHNLGVAAGTVDRWQVAEYLTAWDKVAMANRVLESAGRIDEMDGEGVVPYDWRTSPGARHGSIPDALAHLDFDRRRDDRPAIA